jgi:pyruvate formate lyase activating enzyme
MTFKGWQKTSLLEYPGKVATVLFAGGCGFRCPFCYNAALVLAHEEIPDLDAEVVLSYLAANRRLYQAVVVSGGEPTLAPGLPGFLERVGRLGLLRGLATNGSRPEVLRALLERALVEYVAMDVKAPLHWEAYRAAAGLEEGARDVLERVQESIAVLLQANVQVEFRCTAVPGLHSAPDLLALAGQLRGAPRVSARVRLALQSFRPGPTLAPALSSAGPYPAETLQVVAEQVRGWFSSVEVRS